MKRQKRSAKLKRITDSPTGTVRKLKAVSWPQLDELHEQLRALPQNVQVKQARKLLLVIGRVLGGIYYVAEQAGDCEDNAWQLALALKELCELQYGQGSEYCNQEFMRNLAVFLQPCGPDGGGPG